MAQYRKKPVVIEAIQFNENYLTEIKSFCKDAYQNDQYPNHLFIPTPEGVMAAKPYDWIIKGVKGEFYPCKPDIFEATYEPPRPVAPVDAVKEQPENSCPHCDISPVRCKSCGDII